MLINITLEARPLSTRVAAVVVTAVVASVAAGFAASVFYDRAYLCAIAWAMAAIADKRDFRREALPSGVAEGVEHAFSILSAALLVFGVSAAVVGSRVRRVRVPAIESEGGGGGGGVGGAGGGGGVLDAGVEGHSKAE